MTVPTDAVSSGRPGSRLAERSPQPVNLHPHDQPARLSRFDRFAQWYRGCALLLLNTLLFFVVLNLLLWAAINIWHGVTHDDDKVSHGYSPEALRQVYPDLTDAQRNQLLTETWRRPFVYEQFLEFKEQPIQGQYVTVNEQGCRVTPPAGPWPIDPKNRNVFVFGGSTTFGYGVADDQTIPYYIQQLLANSGDGRRTCVYNFARGFYYSTQERIQFEQALQSGIKPDLAVFIDGLNDFYHATGVLPFTTQLQIAMDPNHVFGRDVMALLKMSPIGRITNQLTKRPEQLHEDIPTMVNGVVQHYLWNKQAIEAIAKVNGVRVAFVFQPVPQYHYDLKYHPFVGNDWTQHRYALAGYPVMATYVADHPMGDDFLWLADIQVGIQKPLYCDQIHYTPPFAHEIAGKICDFLTSKSLLAQASQ
jgi:hypothetical protein